MNLGIRYYYGLVDILIDDSTPGQYNRAWYFQWGFPSERETVELKVKITVRGFLTISAPSNFPHLSYSALQGLMGG